MKKYKTTEKHFHIFKKEALKWVKKYGLFFDYEIDFRHSFFQEKAEALNEYSVEDRWSIIYLHPIWVDYEPTTYNLKRAAHHEVCELVLGKLCNLAESKKRDSTSNINEAIHKTIKLLENAYWFDSINEK